MLETSRGGGMGNDGSDSAKQVSSLSAQGYVEDPRNDLVQVYVDGAFFPRDQAMVSVFDSGFVLGDGVWEGLRLVAGKLVLLSQHLDRLFEGAKSIALDIGMKREEESGKSNIALQKVMEMVLDMRKKAKENKDFATSDLIRDQLAQSVIGFALAGRGADAHLQHGAAAAQGLDAVDGVAAAFRRQPNGHGHTRAGVRPRPGLHRN